MKKTLLYKKQITDEPSKATSFGQYQTSVETIALSDVKEGVTVKLLEISDPDLELKMMEYGYIKGSKITIIERALSGDPFVLENASTRLVLRKSEVSKMKVAFIV